MLEALSFAAPNGTTFDFSDDQFLTLWGVAGRFMPVFEIIEDEIPNQPGSHIRTVKTKPTEIAVPVFVEGEDYGDMRTVLRSLSKALNPEDGDGELSCLDWEGNTRTLLSRYNGGLSLAEDKSGGKNGIIATLIMRATQEPYWLGEPIEDTIDQGSGDPGSFFPIFPMRFANSTIFGNNVQINNPGDVAAYPIWTAVGPGEDLVIRDEATGRGIALDYTLAAGESLVVDSRPYMQSITKNDGTRLRQHVTERAYFFGFQPEYNNFTIEFANTSAASSVGYSFRPRYLSS